ncbi:hypothetical protein [Streptomyces fradiae]|uniref:hypothetical protein n=1 Tax=Streptomyces fradiae TaxID=1906 RepID=UPI0036FA7C8B
MSADLLIGLTKARIALIIAGLAWTVGLVPAWPTRAALAVLVLAALLFDAVVDEHTSRAKPPPRPYDTAA